MNKVRSITIAELSQRAATGDGAAIVALIIARRINRRIDIERRDKQLSIDTIAEVIEGTRLTEAIEAWHSHTARLFDLLNRVMTGAVSTPDPEDYKAVIDWMDRGDNGQDD